MPRRRQRSRSFISPLIALRGLASRVRRRKKGAGRVKRRANGVRPKKRTTARQDIRRNFLKAISKFRVRAGIRKRVRKR